MEKPIINKTGDGSLHRWRKPNFTELTNDYTLEEDIDDYTDFDKALDNGTIRMLHIDEVFEGMQDNATDEDIDLFSKVVNSVKKKLKSSEGDIVIIENDEPVSGGTPMNKRGNLFFFTTLPMVSETINGNTWLYFPNENTAREWYNNQGKLNESYDEENYASAYYGTNFSGREDSIETDDVSTLDEWIWDKLQSGLFVEAVRMDVRHRYSPDKVEFGDEVYGIEDFEVE